MEFADTLRRKLAQARDEVTRLRHLAEAQAAEIQGLRKDLGKRKRALVWVIGVFIRVGLRGGLEDSHHPRTRLASRTNAMRPCRVV